MILKIYLWKFSSVTFFLLALVPASSIILPTCDRDRNMKNILVSTKTKSLLLHCRPSRYQASSRTSTQTPIKIYTTHRHTHKHNHTNKHTKWHSQEGSPCGRLCGCFRPSPRQSGTGGAAQPSCWHPRSKQNKHIMTNIGRSETDGIYMNIQMAGTIYDV